MNKTNFPAQSENPEINLIKNIVSTFNTPKQIIEAYEYILWNFRVKRIIFDDEILKIYITNLILDQLEWLEQNSQTEEKKNMRLEFLESNWSLEKKKNFDINTNLVQRLDSIENIILESNKSYVNSRHMLKSFEQYYFEYFSFIENVNTQQIEKNFKEKVLNYTEWKKYKILFNYWSKYFQEKINTAL